MSAEEQQRAAELRRELQVQGVQADDDPANDPLISIDRHNSTFIYRASDAGFSLSPPRGEGRGEGSVPSSQSRLIQLTSLPGLRDIENDLAKAEDSARIETARRESIDKGEPVVLLNSATALNGSYEVGPLLRDKTGKVAGVRAGSKAVDQTFAALNELPVTERARR